MASGASILASEGALVGSIALIASGVVVVTVVAHNLYVRSSRLYISSGTSFCKVKYTVNCRI